MEETWTLDDLTALLIVLYLVCVTSELPVLWDNTVPHCVSQHDPRPCHLQPKALSSRLTLTQTSSHQVDLILLWDTSFYRDLALPLSFGFIKCMWILTGWFLSLFPKGLCLRPGFFTGSNKEPNGTQYISWNCLGCWNICIWCCDCLSFSFIPSFLDSHSDVLLWSCPCSCIFCVFCLAWRFLINLFSSLPSPSVSPYVLHSFLFHFVFWFYNQWSLTILN